MLTSVSVVRREDDVIEPQETEIVGHWVEGPSGVEADANCRRIESLVRDYLVFVARSSSGWETLFRDPADGRLWERTYPQSEMHGGGPPSLGAISAKEAGERYADHIA